jgi:hypothetical protein
MEDPDGPCPTTAQRRESFTGTFHANLPEEKACKSRELEHGNPKSARVYPDGHYMGRTPAQPSGHIAATIVAWLKEQLPR